MLSEIQSPPQKPGLAGLFRVGKFRFLMPASRFGFSSFLKMPFPLRRWEAIASFFRGHKTLRKRTHMDVLLGEGNLDSGLAEGIVDLVMQLALRPHQEIG